jgi:hypothetical protein
MKSCFTAEDSSQRIRQCQCSSMQGQLAGYLCLIWQPLRTTILRLFLRHYLVGIEFVPTFSLS